MDEITLAITIICILLPALILLFIFSILSINKKFDEYESTNKERGTRQIGEEAEYEVDLILKAVKRQIGGEIYKNIILKDKNGHCSEIDHIYASRYGIYLIETKSWKGIITGDINYDQWKEVLRSKKTLVHYHKNPIKQNFGHFRTFKKIFNYLQNTAIKPIVVFMSKKIDFIECKDVVLSKDLYSLIIKNSKQPIIEEMMYNGIIRKLNRFANSPVMTHDEYVEYIRLRHGALKKS